LWSRKAAAPGQSFLRGVKELIDEVRLNSDVPCQHVFDETVGQFVFRVEDARHFARAKRLKVNAQNIC